MLHMHTYYVHTYVRTYVTYVHAYVHTYKGDYNSLTSDIFRSIWLNV